LSDMSAAAALALRVERRESTVTEINSELKEEGGRVKPVTESVWEVEEDN